MQWIFCFAVALIICAAGVVQLFLPRTSHLVDAGTSARFRRMAASVFAAATVLFLPIYGEIFAGEPLRWLKVLLLSVHNTIRLFIVDGEFTIVTDHLTADNGWIFTPYSVLFAALFVAAPLLTFGVVLSFSKTCRPIGAMTAAIFEMPMSFRSSTSARSRLRRACLPTRPDGCSSLRMCLKKRRDEL